jgi:MFS family permease
MSPGAGAPPALPPLEGTARVLGTLALSLAIFMNVLDTSIANVSMPAISGDLGVSQPDQGTWVITSFGVANAISVPLTGWLTRRFGAGAPVHAVDFPVRHRLVPLRPRALHRHADLLPRRAGRGRRAHDSAVAVAADVQLSAGPPEYGARPCGH